ncbi:sensor histidine kinase [Phreatobacter sp. AB_2022a]|uniref:sensor histidine kinase n=1 Tax=Phreatobacter sp. AB_2022a TaxID=3003134 RepID=UPI0022872F99|nr:ATP-binding protein [Phreatobacter sp. AB_2022a]MCZ0738424.1 ATP-binding protein [Phreatobacter sp. AB_2022a]
MTGASGTARRWLTRRAAIGLALGAIVLVALDLVAREIAARWAHASVRAAAGAAAELRVAVLQSEIEKHRALPLILAEDRDLREALASRAPERIAALNPKLETLSANARVSVIYLLDRDGTTVAASNWRTPTSFVGNNYAFRPYYRRAMDDGAAEHFAFGTVSQLPGLYLTRRLDGPAGVIGVIVVKVEAQAIEADWRRFAMPTFVTDERSIVLISSEPNWVFRATQPIALGERAAIRASLQFGDASLELLPLERDAGADGGLVATRLSGEAGDRRFVDHDVPVPTTRWRLHVLAPVEPTLRLATTAAEAVALFGGSLGLGAIGLWRFSRRRRARAQLRQEEVRRELEARVSERTAELEAVNDRLIAEIDERKRTQAALDDLQDELVQASKLAVLGQISASVAHEINQPVAAIRTFADNARELIQRNEPATADGNLATIASLTDRIGSITGELRAFARKAPARVEAVPVKTVVDGALLLVGHRLRLQAIDLDVDIAEPGLSVTADRIRLEQVLVNLLQNALEALAGRDDGRIHIAGRRVGDGVAIDIADNGPGLPPAVMDHLFMPFTTTKPQGLGLGLVISNDIITETGGTLAVANRGGAHFTITLPRAS